MDDYRKRYEEEQRKLNAELDELVKTCSPEELDKRFLRNFGCVNFQSDEFFHELGLARIWHSRRCKENPAGHDVRRYDKYRCYHVVECTCGFSEACDSSD